MYVCASTVPGGVLLDLTPADGVLVSLYADTCSVVPEVMLETMLRAPKGSKTQTRELLEGTKTISLPTR